MAQMTTMLTLLLGVISAVAALLTTMIAKSNKKILAEVKLSVNGRLDPILELAKHVAAEKLLVTARETAEKLSADNGTPKE